MNSVTRYKIASNIKELREAHGETLKELGDAIGVTKTAIGNYESGVNIPPLERVIAITNHYDVPIGSFLHSFIHVSDCSSIALAYETVMDTIDVAFPVFDLAHADKDEDFSHGVKQHLSIMRQLKTDGYISGFNVKSERIIGAYMKSIESSECHEAAANALSLIFLLWANTNRHSMEKALQLSKDRSDLLPNGTGVLLKSAQYSETRDAEFCRDFDPIVLGLIDYLKQDSSWCSVGDYYFALRFLLGLIDNDSDFATLCEVGVEMLISYSVMGNERAYALLQNIYVY